MPTREVAISWLHVSRRESGRSYVLDVPKMKTDLAKDAILDRIKTIEEEIAKGREYLESGAHANWHGFRALFADKTRDGKELPPHKEWVKHVFLPARERALVRAERLLERLSLKEQKRRS
jgi:hypothetical protein